MLQWTSKKGEKGEGEERGGGEEGNVMSDEQRCARAEGHQTGGQDKTGQARWTNGQGQRAKKEKHHLSLHMGCLLACLLQEIAWFLMLATSSAAATSIPVDQLLFFYFFFC